MYASRCAGGERSSTDRIPSRLSPQKLFARPRERYLAALFVRQLSRLVRMGVKVDLVVRPRRQLARP